MFSHVLLRKLKSRRAQVLLPAVMIVPIFVLVVYLLFETAKVSMTKVRQQFALDNAAYSQVSAASTYLNALGLVNGPLPYRVMQAFSADMDLLRPKHPENHPKISIFELFYKGGGVPTIGPDYDTGNNKPPKAESLDWGLKYYQGDEMNPNFPRTEWEKENPSLPPADKHVPVMSEALVDEYFFPAKDLAVPTIVQYLETYARVGSIYKSQDYVYKQLSKNAIMFREAYYLNVSDCKKSECGRESAAQLRQWMGLSTTPFELDAIEFYASESDASGNFHGGAFKLPFKSTEILNGDKLFQFAFLDSSSRSRLKTLSRGVVLTQKFKLPRNHFNINLQQKYKPYVRTRVTLSCPRESNNCVWPNPLPKYGITLDP